MNIPRGHSFPSFRTRSLLPLVGVLALNLGDGVHAQEHSAFYLGIAGGVDHQSASFASSPNINVTAEVRRKGVATIYGGYRLTPSLAVEAGHVSLGDYAARVAVGTTVSAQVAESKSTYLALAYAMPVVESVQFTARIGVGRGCTGGTQLTLGPSSHATSAIAGVGIAYRVRPNVALTADATYYGKVSDYIKARVATVGVQVSF